jgi:hypothetical protein
MPSWPGSAAILPAGTPNPLLSQAASATARGPSWAPAAPSASEVCAGWRGCIRRTHPQQRPTWTSKRVTTAGPAAAPLGTAPPPAPVPAPASPRTASGLVRNESPYCNPLASSWVTPSARAPSTTAVTIHTSRGWRATRTPIRAHRPRGGSPGRFSSAALGLEGEASVGRVPADVRGCHPDAGVREAVAYLDEHVGTRRGHAGVEARPQQGLLRVGARKREVNGESGTPKVARASRRPSVVVGHRT